MKARWRVSPLVGLLVGLVLLGVGAWIGSALVTSPEEAALQAGPPAPSLITAHTELRQVSQEVVVRGEAQPTVVVSGLSSSTPEGATVALLSEALPSLGDEFESGAKVAEVSGRPVILLAGDVPQYRPLGAGVVGDDVAQLQEALTGLGLSVTDPVGSFGESTWAAVAELYSRNRETAPDGGMVPVGELIFVPGFPASVIEVKGQIGDPATDSVLRLASGSVRITAAVPAAQRELVMPEAKVILASEVLGVEVPGKVGPPVALQEGASGFEFIPDEPLPATWAGQGVRVRVVSASTDAKVLAVPVAALFMSGDGQPELVLVTDPTATPVATRRLAVKVGVVGGGYAEVTPVDGSGLEQGQAVVLSGAGT